MYRRHLVVHLNPRKYFSVRVFIFFIVQFPHRHTLNSSLQQTIELFQLFVDIDIDNLTM